MKKLIVALLLISSVGAIAQDAKAVQSRLDEIAAKARRADLLNQILPVLMTKPQMKALLPVMEKCRQKVRETEAAELKALKGLELKVDKAISDGLTRNQVPPRNTMKEIASTYRVLGMIRAAVIGENTDSIYAVLDRELNDGQKKAAFNALNPTAFDPKLDKASMSNEKKLKFWIKIILLDNEAYDLIFKLSR